MSEYNVAGIKTCTEAEGPFKRTAIWFQGCNICCKGCCNPELQPPIRKHIISLDSLVNICLDAREEFGTEGVTLLGGEPTLQDILPLCTELRRNGLGVILFTGLLREDLDPGILREVDLLVDGPYIREEGDTLRNLVGSSNQRISDLSGRYSEELRWFTDKRCKKVEISLNDDDLFLSGDVLL